MNETKWIAHHGILGQKWGVRRYQRIDGSLTPEGKKRLMEGKTIDGFNQKRFDKSENRRGRLSSTQKEKYNFNERVQLEKEKEKKIDEIWNDSKKWEKYARKTAEERYDKQYDPYIDYKKESREKYIKDFIEDSLDSMDTSSLVTDYITFHDPEVSRLESAGKDWIKNVVEKEGKTGVLTQAIMRQISDEAFKDYFVDKGK